MLYMLVTWYFIYNNIDDYTPKFLIHNVNGFVIGKYLDVNKTNLRVETIDVKSHHSAWCCNKFWINSQHDI